MAYNPGGGGQAMGSTGKIVPINRDLIRQEADSSLDSKLVSVLDAKMAAFEESKRELYELQANLTEKMHSLEESQHAVKD